MLKFIMMRKLTITLLLFVGLTRFLNAQAIIPFPNLREQADAGSYGQEGKDGQYAQFGEDYQMILRRLDGQIEEVNKELQGATNGEQRGDLERSLKELLQKKAAILDEIELVDDLQKFY